MTAIIISLIALAIHTTSHSYTPKEKQIGPNPPFVLPAATISHPYYSSSVTMTLRSREQTKQIPPKHPCSCQLIVFSVYDDRYNLTLEAPQTKQSHIKLKIKSTGACLGQALDQTKTATFDISDIQYNDASYEITESFSFQLYTPSTFHLPEDPQEDCSGVQDQGEQRVAYLVNRTKQELQGQYQYIINLPKNSIAVTQAAVFVLLILLSRNIKYRRFTPLKFSIPLAVFYSVFLFATVYIETYIDDRLQVTFWLVFAFSLVFTTLYLVDLTSIVLNHTLAILAVSLLLASLIAAIDILVLPDAWPVNDLIGVMVSGALIKFIVIKKIKSAIIPMVVLWLFFLIRQFIVLFHLQNFQQALQIKLVPLFLQLPAIFNDDPTGFSCSAFGTSKLITMGLLLNYSVRVDLFLSTRFYTTLVTVLAFLALFIEYLILLFADQLPVLQYTSVLLFVPAAIVVMLLCANKRGEWAELWHGSFHDIAVDRKSIKRDSNSIMDPQELDRNLQQLKMNPSLLTNN